MTAEYFPSTKKERLDRWAANDVETTSLSDKPTTSTVPSSAKPTQDNALLAVFYATGSADATFKARAIGWKAVADGSYVPVNLAELTLTLGTKDGTGSAGGYFDDTYKFVDTIAVDFGGDSVRAFSPAGNQIAHVLVDLRGCEFYELVLSTQSAVTNCNALTCTL